MKRICSICARGGSKGVKNKNLKTILGKPLIALTIEQALKSKLFEHISVSSDSDEILAVAKKYGADIIVQRPDELSTDTAAKLPVIQHCFRESEKVTGKIFETIVDLDCTSPLRSVNDIIESVKKFESHSQGENLITAMPARRSPFFNMVKINDKGFAELVSQLDRPVVRRQDAPQCFDMNASIYIWSRESLLKSQKVISDKTLLFEMPEERSIDIDSELDFEFVSFLLERRKHE